MKKIFTLITLVLMLGISGPSSILVSAQDKKGDVKSTQTGDIQITDCPDGTKPPCKNTPTNTGTKNTVTKNDNTNFDLNIKLQNPLKVDTIQGAVAYFMNVLIKIALPFIVIFFLWSGLKFILAQGNPTKIGEAKKMFWYTIIGTLLILGAWTITNAIIGTVNSLIG